MHRTAAEIAIDSGDRTNLKQTTLVHSDGFEEHLKAACSTNISRQLATHSFKPATNKRAERKEAERQRTGTTGSRADGTLAASPSLDALSGGKKLAV